MPNLAVASLTAEWVAVLITAAGLGSLVTQIGAYRSLLDPFHDNRGPASLGLWAEDEDLFAHLYLKRPTPRGPRIEGKCTEGLCGLNVIHVSRKPIGMVGRASWTKILEVFHPDSLNMPSSLEGKFKGNDPVVIPMESPWKARLQTRRLRKNRDRACTTITRTAFITCLVLSNAYQIYKYSGAAGLRVAYSGYTGIWELQWPLGASAEVEFFPLDSHDPAQEMHPRTFKRRVDKCNLMLMGVIIGPTVGKLGFAEPKDSGCSVLEYHKNGFIAHGKTTHLYNMMGGNYYDVDYLLRRPYHSGNKPPENALKLSIPNPEFDLNRKPLPPRDQEQQSSFVFVPDLEQNLLAAALDCLPWSPLGWSVHRGMQSLLVAYGELTMKAYRPALAYTLREGIRSQGDQLECQGWRPSFVRNYMADAAAASVMMDGGDSGDSVRIVTAVALSLWSGRDEEELDDTKFWRSQVGRKFDEEIPVQILETDVVIALTKLFVLEWSNELDHKLYEDLPLEMLVA